MGLDGRCGTGLAGWCVCGTDYCLDGTGWCISPGYSDVGRRKGAETRAEGSISASEGKTLGAGDFATQQCHCQRNTAYCAGSIAGGGWPAVLGSTVLIVIFGEV